MEGETAICYQVTNHEILFTIEGQIVMCYQVNNH